MAKQTPTIKNPAHQDAIARAKAGKGMKSDLAQGAKKPLPQEELDKLNVKAVDAQQTEVVADASATGAAQTAEAATIGSATEAGAAAGTISPLAIGAGVLGVVAIAAASGGSSGGNGGSNNQALADGSKPNQNTQEPGKGTDTVTDGGAGGGTDGADAGAGTTQPGNQNPVPPQYGQATAKGSPEAPTVSPDGETKLSASKDAFTKLLTEAGKTDANQQFIRIDRILAAEGSDPDARLVRYPETPENGAQGVAVSPKAPGAPVAVQSGLTAYEVIQVEGGITLADAKATAEKLGGKLLMVNDAAEAKWLDEAFKNFLGENTGEADLPTKGAWIGGHAVAGDGKFDAAIRAEGAQASKIHYFDHGAEKLNAFVVEFSNYQHPLTLNGKPVAEGQVINAEDFDKLVWNADGNTRGKISFSVVDSAEATEAGATKGDLEITESASVTRPILNAGTGGNTTPDAGNNTPADPNAGSGANNQAGGSDNAGGSTGSGGNTPKPLPAYPQNDAATVSVTENKADTKLDKSLFIGTDEAKAPEFVKILTVNLPGLASDIGDKTALFITHSDKVENIANDTPEFVLHKSLFDKISWNASLANGGSFTFVPVADEKGTAIPGAKTQTVTINETPATPANPADGQQTPGNEQQPPGGQQNQDSNPQDTGSGQQSQNDNPQNPSGNQQGPGGTSSSPDAGSQGQGDGQQQPPKAAPEYGQDPLSVEVTHNNEAHNFESAKAMFEGTGNTKATHVKITEIKNGAASAAEGTLKYKGVNVGNENNVIALNELDQLVWDASKAEGGSFKFTPVADAQGTAIDGATAQSVTINEGQAPQPLQPEAPTYANEAVTSTVETHNKTDHKFTEILAKLEGTGNKATHIKITEIKNGTAGSPEAEEGTLKYKDANVGSNTNNLIALNELDQLVWDASKAVGGSFKFTAVQANGEPFANPPATQTVSINEPLHTPTPEQKEVAKYGQTALEKALFDSSVEGNTNPEFVKIISITPTADDTAAKRVVNESTKTAYQVVKVDKGISLEDAEQAAKAMGGKLLEISNQDELDFIKGEATLMGKLNQLGEDTDSAKKGAWFKNPDANQAAAANDKEGIFSNGTSEDNVQFVDVEASTGKLNAYIVEFNDYDSPKSALLVGDEGEKKAVSNGQVLDKDEQGKLSWDSMFNSGGEVKFIEVTAKKDGQNAPGAVENTLTITEADVTGTLLQDHMIL